MRARVLAVSILLLAGCGDARRTEVRYDVNAAVSCIKVALPADTGRSSPEDELPGGFWFSFGDDHFSYLLFVVSVGYGSDRQSATANQPVMKHLQRRHVWGRADGNVVYDAYGPLDEFSLKVRPPGLTVRKIRRWAEISSGRMRTELGRCLAKARRGTRRSPPPRKNPRAPTVS